MKEWIIAGLFLLSAGIGTLTGGALKRQLGQRLAELDAEGEEPEEELPEETHE